ncbi:hypothetical protein AVEN_95871-1 [Araneus ventricosus]|uniref:Uncharacterized protein n=1 Tax=Araneus ventricosus TaxID=182803 RepID=A0A4Y2W222_ARAVE|nr:hypothetical protein AVEN_95871-1 [Araneus ventricosus]
MGKTGVDLGWGFNTKSVNLYQILDLNGQGENDVLDFLYYATKLNIKRAVLRCLLIDTDICKIPGYPLLKCQKVVADRFSEEVDGFRRSKASLCNPGNY